MQKPLLNRSSVSAPYQYPIKAIQIGEGNFIRAFVNWMLDQANQQGVLQGAVVASQPRPQGAAKLEKLKKQDGLFTIIIRGIQNGEPYEDSQLVSSITQLINPYTEWESFLALADNPDIEYIFSNTTEAGIAYVNEVGDFTQPIHSYPGKLTALLYRRYKSNTATQGFMIFPCELLERAGDDLRELVLQHAQAWGLGDAFMRWVWEQNLFINSIVDRIVTGYPHEEAERLGADLGYQDELLTVAEPYYQWILEGNSTFAERFPLHQAGLNVHWVEDLKPYNNRKVRILNGAHTFIVPLAIFKGYETVKQAMEDEALVNELEQYLYQYVVPTLPFSKEALADYISQTFDRFRNPFLHHKLMDIALNSTSKFMTRILPTLLELAKQGQQLPASIFKSLAHLLRFYRCKQELDGEWWGSFVCHGEVRQYRLKDAEHVLHASYTLWQQYEQTGDVQLLVEQLLSSDELWGRSFQHYPQLDFKQICQQTGHALSKLLEPR